MKYMAYTDWEVMQHLHTGDGRSLLGHRGWWLDLELLLDGGDGVLSSLARKEKLRVRRTVPDVNHTTFHLDAFEPSQVRHFFQVKAEESTKAERDAGADDLVWVELTVVDTDPASTDEDVFMAVMITGHYSQAKDNGGIATMLISEMQLFQICRFDSDDIEGLLEDAVEIDRIVIDIVSRGEGSCR